MEVGGGAGGEERGGRRTRRLLTFEAYRQLLSPTTRKNALQSIAEQMQLSSSETAFLEGELGENGIEQISDYLPEWLFGTAGSCCKVELEKFLCVEFSSPSKAHLFLIFRRNHFS